MTEILRDHKCPYCDSTEIEGGHVDTPGNRQALQEEFCCECYAEWTNIYTLTYQNRTET